MSILSALLVAFSALGPVQQEGVGIPAPVSPAPRVALVELRTDDPDLAAGELERLVTVVPGDPLSDFAVRQTLRNLQATGAAAEVALFTRPATPEELARLDPLPGPERSEPPPVVVVVAVWAALQVEKVELIGELGLPRRLLEAEIDVRVGQPLIADQVLRSVYALQELYEGRGYLDASVRPEIDRNAARQRVTVTFEATAGPVTRVTTVDFDGTLTPFTAEQLLGPLSIDPGNALRREALRTDRERLTRWLIRRGYTRAQVGEPVETEQGEHEVSLVWPVEVGPRLELEVRGVPEKELKRARLLPFLELGYDDALLAQAESRIIRHLQAKGHWRATARFLDPTTAEGVEYLVLEVEPGPLYTVTSIEFEGERTLPKDELEARMATAPRSLLRPGSGRLVSSVFDDDLENLRSFYRLRGFPEVAVGPARIDEQGTDLAITIPIDEGTRRVTIGKVELEGADSLDQDDLRKAVDLPSQDNPGYHPLALEDALTRVRQLYEDEGYLSAQVSAEESWNATETVVDLRIRVIEGPRTTVDRVIVRGNIETRREVIEDVLDLRTGEPISPLRLQELERNLYRLGIFRRVDVDFAPSGEPGESTRDIIVRVEESQSLRLAFGPGWDSLTQWRAGAILTQPNLFGRAWSLRVDARSNFDAEHLARVRLRQPSFTRWNIPLSYELAYEEESRGGLRVRREIARVQGLWGFGKDREEVLATGKRHQLGLAFDYREVDSDLELDDPEDRPFLRTEVSSIVPSLVLDYRDDPIDPRRGWILSTQLQRAFPVTGLTETEFTKFSLLGGFHLPIGKSQVRRQTLSLGLRLGGIDSHGAVPVPVSERFIAGGAYTHRAYSVDDPLLFVDCGRDPACRFAGGGGLALVNLDFRVAVFGAVSAAIFVDSGNVWPDWRDLDFSDFATGVGLEVAYSSPIGPVRVGYGWKLDPRDGEPRGHGFLAIGYPF